MTYHPRMTNRIEGFSVISSFHRRYWEGMAADLWDVSCAPTAGGSYVGSDPRIFALLGIQGEGASGFEISASGASAPLNVPPKSLIFVPAGLALESEARGLTAMRHLDLHFDRDALTRRLGEDFDPAAFETPRFSIADPAMIALAELIARECASDDRLHNLYGDGLTLALLIGVLRITPSTSRKRGRLAPWQMRRVTDFIEQHCLRRIRLEELAELTGLSQSYFSHAFKATTGLPPHQWQMRARMTRVKQLLAEGEQSLTEIAAETGFADPAHFTRVFRRLVGVSPSAWRRRLRG
jgi:AraC family transcriptional regulator